MRWGSEEPDEVGKENHFDGDQTSWWIVVAGLEGLLGVHHLTIYYLLPSSCIFSNECSIQLTSEQ